MIADFIYQPISGAYKELYFDVETIWRGGNWSWVKFEYNGEEWVGAFRGYPLKIAFDISNNHYAVLTENNFFIIHLVTRQLIYSESNTVIRDVVYSHFKNHFLISTYNEIGVLNNDFIIDLFPIQEQLYFIKLLNVENEFLYFKCDVIVNYTYSDKIGSLNLATYELIFK